MANTLSGSLTVSGNSSITQTTGSGVNSSNMAGVTPGSNTFPEMVTSLSNGTGSGQANEQFAKSYDITTGANQDLDLTGTALQNGLGENIAFTAIKLFVVAIHSPDGTKKVRVGPQGVANAWQGPYGGTGATVYEEVLEYMVKINQYGGWTVTAGTGDILRINNPGASTVTVSVWLLGTK